ncbi:MAG TPA: hypothetical protein VED40_09345 [Azospirillaceae bacterium]|nr:hypothetical protein [Azospirillaceae bacterium]
MRLPEALAAAANLYLTGQPAAAAAACRAILRTVPDQADALHLLGVAEAALGHGAAAERALTLAIAVRPESAEAYGNLGVLMQRQGRGAAAWRQQSRALRLDPGNTGTRVGRALTLLGSGNPAAALEDLRIAIRHVPGDARAARLLAAAARLIGHLDMAIAAARRAVLVRPDDAEAHRELGHALRAAGAPVAAARAYRRAWRLAPRSGEAAGDLLVASLTLCDWSDHDRLTATLKNLIDTGAGVVAPLVAMVIDTDAAQQDRAARHFYRAAVAPDLLVAGPARRARWSRRLHLGYLSADLQNHATANLVAELFELHDRAGFRVAAFSYGPDDGSAMRRRIACGVDRFHDIGGMASDAVAALLAIEEIDILVDLKGWTKDARPDLLRQRLAPVQVSWLGYPGPSGCPFMDYLLGDPVVTPAEDQPFYLERLAILPETYQVNDRRRPLDGRTWDRRGYGLPETGPVFCCFNATVKIAPAVFAVWMRLLAQLSGSVLWLLEPPPPAADALRRAAVAAGIDPKRLVFAPRLAPADHLARYRAADIVLDTFPYTGHTTTSDALWMGAPVVTLQGGTFASRVAGSLMRAAGLPQTIAFSLAEYEALALSLARSPGALAVLRRRLEAGRATVPLFDTPRFTHHLEAAFRIMADRHAAGLPPQTFAVPALPAGI